MAGRIVSGDSRFEHMQHAIDGFDKTGSIGVSFKDGEFITLSNGSDDHGIYLFSQIIHKFFNLNVDEIAILFHFLFITSGFILFIVGWFLLFKNNIAKFFSVIATLCLTILAHRLGNIYIMFYFISSFIPLFLYIKAKQKTSYMIVFLFFVCFFGTLSNLFRMYSGLSIFIFILAYFAKDIKNNAKFILSMIVFISIFMGCYKVYDINNQKYLLELNPNDSLNTQHVFWHNIYIGFGFVDNDYIPRYLDETGMQKVQSIDPSVRYCSKEYEKILKNETFKFIKEHFLLFFQNIFAKFGVMFGYFLVFANIGIYCFYKVKDKSKDFLIPCMLTICFNSLFGFLVVPSPRFLLGFISLSMIFAIYYVNLYLEERRNIVTSNS